MLTYAHGLRKIILLTSHATDRWKCLYVKYKMAKTQFWQFLKLLLIMFMFPQTGILLFWYNLSRVQHLLELGKTYGTPDMPELQNTLWLRKECDKWLNKKMTVLRIFEDILGIAKENFYIPKSRLWKTFS